MEETIIKLVNPAFTINFAGKDYSVRKATLDKAIQYQQRLKDLKDDVALDAKIVGYCLYILLKDQDAALTEDYVIQNIPADINGLETLTKLGFINPSTLALIQASQTTIINKLTSGNSSPA